MVRRLQHRRLIVPGTNMLRLELTQEGFARLDGSPHEGKPTLPTGLLRFARTKAMAKLHELRREGFADPVDALLAIEGRGKVTLQNRVAGKGFLSLPEPLK